MIHGCLATGLDAVPADNLKWTLIVLMGLAIFGMQVVGAFRKPGATAIEPDPLRVVKMDKFATRDFCDMKHSEVARRLDAHDAAIQKLYDEIKAERSAQQIHASERSKTLFQAIGKTRDELTEKIDGVQTALNDKMDAIPKEVINMLSDLSLLNKPK
jgi:hypothetical protein